VDRLVKAVDGELPRSAACHRHAAALSVVAVRAAVRPVVWNTSGRARQHLAPRRIACHCSGKRQQSIKSLFIRVLKSTELLSVTVCNVYLHKNIPGFGGGRGGGGSL
jgi:hypothetical protein